MALPDPAIRTRSPQLSLAMIVRDGGQFLGPLLAAARAHVDEIVIADTGSRDDSVAVARAHGATVLDFPWCDDFAAARNASLAACHGAWILSLDADEQLAAGDWSELRRLASRPVGQDSTEPPFAARIMTRNYVRQPWSRRGWEPVPCPDAHALSADGPPIAAGFVPTWKVRLFPNLDRVRFRGRLHETVEASLAMLGVPLDEVPVIVHHFGLLDQEPAKAARYLELARLKAAEQPSDPVAWLELAEAALVAGTRALALEAAERALALRPGLVEARLTAGSLLKDAGSLARADAHLLAVAACPEVSDRQLALAFHLRAQVAILDGRAETAGPLLLAALRLTPGDGHIHNTLGVWHLAGGRAEPARFALERATALLPHLAEPCLNLGRLHEAAGQPSLAARHFEEALRREAGRGAAAEALERISART